MDVGDDRAEWGARGGSRMPTNKAQVCKCPHLNGGLLVLLKKQIKQMDASGKAAI